MAEEKKPSAAERRYGKKDDKPEETKPEPEAKAEPEHKEPDSDENDGGAADMHGRHADERDEMRKRHEKERREHHGNHRDATRKMDARHEQERRQMDERHDAEMAPGQGTPEADADQMPNAGMSQGAEV